MNSYRRGMLNMAFSCPHPNLLTEVYCSRFWPRRRTLQYIIKALSNTNLLFKYANDTKLLVPEITNVDINDEFITWAADNRMIVNLRKTKEIVFS